MIRGWGRGPAASRCEKVAWKLLEADGTNDTRSLQQLVSRHLGIALAKGPVRRSDWSAAQLTAEQLEYAAGDVLHLLTLLNALDRNLQGAGLVGLYDACCAFLPARVTLEL